MKEVGVDGDGDPRAPGGDGESEEEDDEEDDEEAEESQDDTEIREVGPPLADAKTFDSAPLKDDAGDEISLAKLQINDKT